ncbi:MAG: penicillin acylase family protein [Alphaproteobacteria bacterium]|nr:MAG: penicillin acylase family protein [Alphaproteobacteria bacterium]
MELIFKWLVRLAIGLVILVIGLTALGLHLVTGSLPDPDARHRVEGLSGPVEILRDAHAVPHILAESADDAFFALGFVHAQDRLWQMEIARRTAQGRLSEFFGARSFDIDHLMRALDIYNLSVKAVAHLSPGTRAALEAYAAGVNAWLRIVARDALGRGAPEFLLFADRIAPWTPADSVALTKLMALRLTSHAAEESRRAALTLALRDRPGRLADILPDAPGGAVIDLPEQAGLVPPRRLALTGHARDPFGILPPPGLAGASNAVAIAASRSATGHPLLATDPHLGLSAPVLWYLARIRFPEGDAIGATIPGIPAIVIGRNADFGWGLTTAYVDDQDLRVERIDPGNPERYLTPDGWAPFVTRDVTIEVAGEAPRRVRLRWTRNGPVLPPWFHDVGAITGPGHVMSLSWTALTAEDRSIESLMGLMRAHSIAEALPVLALAVAPAQNVVMADRNGIAMQVAGVAPLRDPAHRTRGRLPSPGWEAENDWTGRVPFEEMPRVIDPPGGIIVNTNNRTTDAPFPLHLTHDWGDSQRIRRARRLLEGREFHSRDSLIEFQTDTVSEAARTLVPLMARDLWWAGQPLPGDEAGRLRQRALARLAEWNGAMSPGTPEPLIYAAWVRALQRRLTQDELGPLQAWVQRVDPVFIERVLRDVDGASIWCDIGPTVAVESCTEIARLALDDALAEITAMQGPRIDSWRWGDAHVALQRHPVLGQEFPFSLFVNVELPTPGGDFTLMRGQLAATGPQPYANVHAAGFRAVYDFSDPNGSVWIISTGQSGHPLSRHYDDLAGLWQRGEYLPMTLDLDAARGGAIGSTFLAPPGP